MFFYSHWLELPIQTRIKIAQQFGIIKKGSTEVVGNQIKSDGYQIKDIEAGLSTEKLQAYVGLETFDLKILWEMMVNKIEGRGAKIELQPTIIPEKEFIEEIVFTSTLTPPGNPPSQLVRRVEVKPKPHGKTKTKKSK